MSDVVEETVRIAAPPEIVWRYWTDPVRLCAWRGVGAEVDARPGGEPKPTDADRARFWALVPDEADVEVKPMFGNLGEAYATAAVLPAKAPKACKAATP